MGGRRTVALLIVAVMGAAGCTSSDNPAGVPTPVVLPGPGDDRPPDPGLSFQPACAAALPLSNIPGGNLPPDAIHSLHQPGLVRAGEADFLLPSDRVFGVEAGGRFIAFPRKILNYHEIVTLALADSSETLHTAITWCPLTFSFIEWRPRWDNPLNSPRAYSFGVSGGLLDNNLVMFDRESRSTWSQILGLAIEGPRAGECLEMGRNAVDTTWDLWRRLHPDTHVLSDENGVAGVPPSAYQTNPYADYWAGREDLLWPVSHEDGRLDEREVVLGVHGENGSAAVLVGTHPVGSMEVGDTPVVVFSDLSSGTAFVFENDLDGVQLGFSFAGSDSLGIPRFVDHATNSTWTLDGIAVDGPARGRRLAQVPAFHVYWFAWATFFPDRPILRM